MREHGDRDDDEPGVVHHHFHYHIIHEFPPAVEQALRENHTALQTLIGKVNTMATDIKVLLDKLEEQTTVSAGYRVAVDAKLAALKAQIDTLTAGQIDAATQARIDAAFASASSDTDADREAAAILAGTPNENPTP